MTDAVPKPKLTAIRWIFAVIGVLIMIFAGGCSLFFDLILSGYSNGNNTLGVFGILLLYGGLPFLLGLLIWRLAVKFRRV